MSTLIEIHLAYDVFYSSNKILFNSYNTAAIWYIIVYYYDVHSKITLWKVRLMAFCTQPCIIYIPVYII